MADDLGERTEDPTPRRREQARREGNVARSRDLAAALMLAVAVALVAALLWPSLEQLAHVMQAVLSGTAGDAVDRVSTLRLVEFVGIRAARVAAPLLLVMFAVAALAHFVQVGWLFAPKVLAPKLGSISPATGLRRIFGVAGLVRAAMDAVKVGLVLAVCVLTVYQHRSRIVVLPHLTPPECVAQAAWMMLDLAVRLAALLLLLGLLDLAFQRWKHTQDLRMTRQQVKDELRQSEGDPEMKARRARMRRQLAARPVDAAVPRADVVVTNPTRLALAIRYDADRMDAPAVVAKGADHLASRIRRIARVHDVPIVERPPLARALYARVAVGDEVPADLYHAVAEVLAGTKSLLPKERGS